MEVAGSILTAGEKQYKNTLPIIANRIRIGDPCGFNKERSSKSRLVS